MFIVVFQGGFANQLFQYAFYLRLAEDYPAQKIYADISHYDACHDHGGFKLGRFVQLDYFKGKKEKLDLHFVNELSFSEKKIDEVLNYIFDGYWQKTEYFPKDISKIRRIFTKSVLSPENSDVARLITESNSISVHVRRGDYVNHFLHGNIANKTYFQNAVDFINRKIESPVFFVFSDDLDWCKANLDFCNHTVHFVEGNSDCVEQDIILMSLCKHNIISNSSFSWWASYLNENKDKIIITPEYWFNQPTATVTELEVQNSVKIPNAPYVPNIAENPFFSIVMPAYNTEKTLRRTLASVLNQTFTDIEVIIVDDCSPDNSYAIFKAYEERDKRIRIFRHEKNSGLLVARLTGGLQANGKYVLFLDSDDWLELNACEILHEALFKNPVDALEFGYVREPDKIYQPIEKDTDSRLEALLRRDYPVTLWNKAYSRPILESALRSFKPFYATFCEDAFFSVIIARFAKSYGYVDSYLHHYSLSTGISTQNEYTAEKFERILRDTAVVNEQLSQFIRDNAPQYEDDVPRFMGQRFSYLSYLAQQNSDKELSAKLLLKIDETFGTSFFATYITSCLERLAYYESIENMNITRKCKFVLKYVAKKMLGKLGVYRK